MLKLKISKAGQYLSNDNIRSNLEAIVMAIGAGRWRRVEVKVIRERSVGAIIVGIEVTDGRTRYGTRGSMYSTTITLISFQSESCILCSW